MSPFHPRSPSLPLPLPLSLLPFLLLLLLLLLSPAAAHQSISYPYPISHDVACRISPRQNCPGPCPRHNLRSDQTPNNPSLTVARNGWITVLTMKNNHRGGFSRWTLVNVRDMHNRRKHAANAFLYTCADIGLSSCSTRYKHRDCHYDLSNQHYRHVLQIPALYPDGVYVLGWAWYGGGERWGLFGDYYDCMYIRVQGGPVAYAHKPIFKPGNSRTRVGDKCRATVNKLGVCWREPCPGGGRWTQLFKPWEFSDRRSPKPIPRSRFLNPYRPKPVKHGSAFVHSLTIRSADYPARVFTSSLGTRFPRLVLTKRMRSTVTCETRGNVRSVTFYVNGQKGRADYAPPYSIAGDWWDGKARKNMYAPWAFQVERKVVTIACRAIGFDGGEHWRNIELSTT